ncbi:MAG: hypothetical protein WKF61_06215 [Luteimonas sp.]
MKPEDFEDLLHVWGKVFGERKASEWDEDKSPTGNSSLAAFGSQRSRTVKRHDVAGRDGRSRRMAMGGAPMWACDPIPCVETRQRMSAPPPDPRVTPMVDRVQSAWLALHGFHKLQAECIRVQYQVRGMTRSEKAELVAGNVSDAITPRRYKDELRLARTWMHARITA